jgi:hypothetical protein
MPVVDLKRELLATPVPVGAIARCAAYLALVVREARGWFIQQEKEAVAGLKLDWTFHLGYPSASLKGDELREIFHATALAAWDLAQGAEAIHRDRALDAAKRSLRGELRSGANIDAIPEVLAEVAGYARSPQRQLGLHFLMDVGAGTTDLCGFILFEGAEDGDNRYTPLTTGVYPLGAAVLHQLRKDAVATESGRHEERGHWDPMAPIPESAADYCSGNLALEGILRGVEAEFIEKCQRTILGHFMPLRSRRNHLAEAWDLGLPVFLAGGGACVPCYGRALQLAIEEFSHRCLVTSPRQMQLPIPENLVVEEQDPRLFSRLAVAYGLSLDRDEFGLVLSAPSDDPPGRGKINWGDGFIDKDQV